MAIQKITMPRADFIVEANAVVGGGHLARCATLAETLARFGWRTRLRTECDPAIILPRAASAFCDWRQGTGPDEPCELAVFDGYEIDERLEQSWGPVAGRRVVIDDLADRPHDAELLLDATPGRKQGDYSQLVPHGARVLTGAKYAILRPTWSMISSRRMREEPGNLRTVIVAIGATDPRDVTSLVLTAVLIAVPGAKIFAILGKGAPHLSAVRVRFSGIVDVLVDPDDYDERVATADLVIGAAGSSALERACVGVPSITCVTAANQVKMAEELSRLGVTKVLRESEWQDHEKLVQVVCSLKNDSQLRQQFSKRGRELVDGRGALRVAVAAVAHRTSGCSLRLFERSDSDWLFALQCMRETRRFARTPDIPTPAQHKTYADSVLASDSRLLLIVERDGRALGYVRLDRGPEETAEVSIAIHPAWHGQGVGHDALELLRALAPGLRFRAFVKFENCASSALFAKAGYIAAMQTDGGLWLESDPHDRL